MPSAYPLEVATAHSDVLTVDNPTLITVYKLEERNRIATDFIRDYANRHTKMDIALGLISLAPGLVFPALAAAIAGQSKFIYQPMARDLARIYMAEPGKLEEANDTIVHSGSIQTAICDVATDFGTEFMIQIATELLTEIGFGVVAAMCVPVIGAIVGAALDYLIATQMTWRVGTMVSIYFQNGGKWVENQKNTFELSKKLTGSMHVGVSDLLDGKFKDHTPRTDLNDIRTEVSGARENLLRNVRGLVSMLRVVTGNDQVRDILKSQGIPIDLIREALG